MVAFCYINFVTCSKVVLHHIFQNYNLQNLFDLSFVGVFPHRFISEVDFFCFFLMPFNLNIIEPK